MSDVVVIGAGIAGLTAALRLATGGASVTLVAGGLGGLQLSQGSVDILGYAPDVVSRPLDAIDALADADPGHPYAILGRDRVESALTWLTEVLPAGTLTGSVSENMRLPTAVGVARPTALAPPSLAAGALRAGSSLAIVGIRVLKDFQPGIVAANIARVPLDGGTVTATPGWIDIPAREGEVDSSPLTFARSMDDPGFRRRVADALSRAAGDADAIGVPAVIGARDPDVWSRLCEEVGRTVFEIPTPPPCVPGVRLNATLTDAVRAAGVRVIIGGWVVEKGSDASGLQWVATNAAGRNRRHAARAFVFAPGGFESGALRVDSRWQVDEPALGLPVSEPPPDGPIVDSDVGMDHPLFLSGLRVDDTMRVLHPGSSEPAYGNVYAAGGILAGAIRWKEKSGEGIAVASAVRAADAILKELS